MDEHEYVSYLFSKYSKSVSKTMFSRWKIIDFQEHGVQKMFDPDFEFS